MGIEWKNGDDVDAYGKPYKYVGLDPFNENLCICLANQDDDPQCFSIGVLKKPETPQQREERELCEDIDRAYDLAPDHLQIPVNLYVAQLLLQMGYRKQ